MTTDGGNSWEILSYSWEILSFKTLIIQCCVEHVETRKVKFHLTSIEGSRTKER